MLKAWSMVSIGYVYAIQILKYLIKGLLGKKEEVNAFFGGIKDGISFLKYSEYKSLKRI